MFRDRPPPPCDIEPAPTPCQLNRPENPLSAERVGCLCQLFPRLSIFRREFESRVVFACSVRGAVGARTENFWVCGVARSSRWQEGLRNRLKSLRAALCQLIGDYGQLREEPARNCIVERKRWAMGISLTRWMAWWPVWRAGIPGGRELDSVSEGRVYREVAVVEGVAVFCTTRRRAVGVRCP